MPHVSRIRVKPGFMYKYHCHLQSYFNTEQRHHSYWYQYYWRVSTGKMNSPNYDQSFSFETQKAKSMKVFRLSLVHTASINILPTSLTTGGTRWRSWLRHCARSRKVAGSIPDDVVAIFHWHNPSGCTVALGLTQPLTKNENQEYFLAGKDGRCIGLTTLPPSCVDFTFTCYSPNNYQSISGTSANNSTDQCKQQHRQVQTTAQTWRHLRHIKRFSSNNGLVWRCRTAGKRSVFGRSCDRPPRHRFFLVSLCL